MWLVTQLVGDSYSQDCMQKVPYGRWPGAMGREQMRLDFLPLFKNTILMIPENFLEP
jgi:hypothetical protein